jgi:hypothetical protein
MPYLKKYIPGSPTITMEFMDGASGRKGANYIYTAKPDGLKIGSAVGASFGEIKIVIAIRQISMPLRLSRARDAISVTATAELERRTLFFARHSPG